MRSMLMQVAYQRQSRPLTLWVHPRRQVISLGEVISRKLKEDQYDSPAPG